MCCSMSATFMSWPSVIMGPDYIDTIKALYCPSYIDTFKPIFSPLKDVVFFANLSCRLHSQCLVNELRSRLEEVFCQQCFYEHSQQLDNITIRTKCNHCIF